MSPLRRTSQNARDSAFRSVSFDVYGLIPAYPSRITRSGVPEETSGYSSDSEVVRTFTLGPPRRRLMETNAEYAMRRGPKPTSEFDFTASSRSTSPNLSDDDVTAPPTIVDYCVGTGLSDETPAPLDLRHAPVGKKLGWLEKLYQDDNCTSIVPTYDEVVHWLKRKHAPSMDSTIIPSLAEVRPWMEVEWKKHMSFGGRSLKKK